MNQATCGMEHYIRYIVLHGYSAPLGRENHIGQLVGGEPPPQGTPGEEEEAQAGLPICAKMTPTTHDTNHHPLFHSPYLGMLNTIGTRKSVDVGIKYIPPEQVNGGWNNSQS